MWRPNPEGKRFSKIRWVKKEELFAMTEEIRVRSVPSMEKDFEGLVSLNGETKLGEEFGLSHLRPL